MSSIHCFPNSHPAPQIVPESSATIDRFGVKVISVSANHVEMCNFVDSGEIGYTRVSDQIMAFIGDEVRRPGSLGVSASKAFPTAPSILPAIDSHEAIVTEYNTKEYQQYMYGIQFQSHDESAEDLSVVDKDFVESSVNKWTKLSDTTLQLSMDNNGSSGSLLFKGKTTGDIFSVTAGIHNYHPWCDILTDLEEGARATRITQSYYRVLNGRLWDNLLNCKKTCQRHNNIPYHLPTRSMGRDLHWKANYQR